MTIPKPSTWGKQTREAARRANGSPAAPPARRFCGETRSCVPICAAARARKSGALREHILLVRGRAIHPGNLDIVQAQVHAELRAVMNQVVQGHAPQHGGSRHAEDLLPLE